MELSKRKMGVIVLGCLLWKAMLLGEEGTSNQSQEEKRGKSRLLVVINESGEGTVEPPRLIEQRVESLLARAGWIVVDKRLSEHQAQRERLFAELEGEEKRQAAEEAKREGPSPVSSSEKEPAKSGEKSREQIVLQLQVQNNQGTAINEQVASRRLGATAGVAGEAMKERPKSREALGWAMRIGADVVIQGSVQLTYSGAAQMVGIPVHSSLVVAQFKAVNTGTAQLLCSEQFSRTFKGSGEQAAAINRAREQAAEELATRIKERLTAAGAGGAPAVSLVTLLVATPDFKKLRELEEKLRSLPSIKSLARRSLLAGKAELEVETDWSATILAEKLSELSSLKVEVTGQESDRIYVKLSDR